MERKQYYAYNKTREAFLSLGVLMADRAGGSFWAALSRRQLRTDEGIWLSSVIARRHAGGFSAPCDTIYLDSKLQVASLTEGVPGLAVPPAAHPFESLLVLPVHTIFSSQTQIGDQVLIGTIEEIGAILDGMDPMVAGASAGGVKVERSTMQAPMKWLARIFSARDRRNAARHPAPPLMAFYWDGGIPIPHAVPDISRTGLFVKTADRWHPRTLLRVTLQKRANDPVQPDETITLQCRVVRVATEGVGMAFMLAEGLYDERVSKVGSLATRKELNRFFERLVADSGEATAVEHPYLPFPEMASRSDRDTAEYGGLPVAETVGKDMQRNGQAN